MRVRESCPPPADPLGYILSPATRAEFIKELLAQANRHSFSEAIPAGLDGPNPQLCALKRGSWRGESTCLRVLLCCEFYRRHLSLIRPPSDPC